MPDPGRPKEAIVEITQAVAEKVLGVVRAGLVSGVGKPVPGQMCVEAAVNYAQGQPHGDEPACVAPSLRRLKIRLNDSRWSSNQARAKGLERLALIQLGSAGALDEPEFLRRVADVTIRRVVPIGLRTAAKRNPKHAEALEAATVRCEQEGTREACLAARTATYAAAAAASAAADARTRDRLLAQYAEWIVQILIDLKAPGCQWLGLAGPFRAEDWA